MNTENEYRERLCPFVGKRMDFTATVQAHGIGREMGYFKTLLLSSVKHNGTVLADHAWINSQISDLSKYQPGDLIKFSAVVMRYRSGYREMKRNKNAKLKEGYTFAGVIIREEC